VPGTTTEFVQRLHHSPAAVSPHLSRLKAAGLVEPHRSGRRVYYRLSLTGESLLEIFEETD
jgi:DNA-binding transcriptional ArsR family regulator